MTLVKIICSRKRLKQVGRPPGGPQGPHGGHPGGPLGSLGGPKGEPQGVLGGCLGAPGALGGPRGPLLGPGVPLRPLPPQGG